MGSVAVGRRVWVGTVLALVGAACQSKPPQPGKVRVGMSRAELVATLGEPVAKDSPQKNRQGQLEEVWHYVLKPEVASGREVTKGVLTSGVGFFDDPTVGHRYLFVFVGDQLARWGPEKAR